MIVFCPKCHKPIRVPDFVKQVKTEKGITVECGNTTSLNGKKLIKCTGKVKIKNGSKVLE